MARAALRKKYAASNRRQAPYRVSGTGRITMQLVVDRRLAGLGALFFSGFALAAGVPGVALEDVVVRAKRVELVVTVLSASQATVTPLQLEMRPILRTGELLETVPGLVVT